MRTDHRVCVSVCVSHVALSSPVHFSVSGAAGAYITNLPLPILQYAKAYAVPEKTQLKDK